MMPNTFVRNAPATLKLQKKSNKNNKAAASTVTTVVVVAALATDLVPKNRDKS